MFRIDVDCRGGDVSHPPPRQPLNGFTANYFIPNDNPFVGQSNVLEEFFCLGLRSPHRMTYDPATGRIFIGDVGESSREEVDVIEPGESGLNFQWNRCEGNLGKMEPPYIGISRGPVLDYPHTDGRAVIGGYVYRGQEFAARPGRQIHFRRQRLSHHLGAGRNRHARQKNAALRHAQGQRAEFRHRLHRPFVVRHGCGRRNLFLPDEQHRRTHFQTRSAAARRRRPEPCPKLLSQTGVFTEPRRTCSRRIF